ncbi:MAG: glycosyltransferase family 2 protein [Symploca sp. SIO2E6]|nr:glycosyltransferase family 2 protein [Symploca sp. SIO2E6]
MKDLQPRISIGLPVYNGEKFLEASLNSLLAQTFKDFELIISDNASTDRTREICQAYAAQDKRIRYYYNQENRGPAWNYNRVFELSRGEYFKWAAHDDICAPEFLEKCTEVLDNHPYVVLCYPKTKIINEFSELIQNYNVELKTSSPKPHERFYDLTRLHHRCYQIFGVIRSSILSSTPLIGNYAGSDRVLLARLSLHGQFGELPEYLFSARRHSQQSIEILFNPKRKLTRLHQYSVWFDPANASRIILPNWRIFHEYLMSIQQAPLSLYERICCYLQMVHWLSAYWNWAKLGRDLPIATIQLLGHVYKNLNNQRHKNSEDCFGCTTPRSGYSSLSQLPRNLDL